MALPQDIDRFIGDYVRAFNARDLERVASLYAEDATLEDPVGSAMVRGKPAIRAFYEQYQDQPSYLQYSGDCRVAQSAIAFSFIACIGTGPDLHIVRIVDSFRFDDAGLISEMRAFWGESDMGGIVEDGAPDVPLLLPLAGRVALVATGGIAIGGACARILARAGARVIVSGDSEAAGERLAEELRAAGGQAIAVSCSAQDAPSRAVDLMGRLDHVVNIAVGTDSLVQWSGASQMAAGGRPGAIVDIVIAPGEKLAVTPCNPIGDGIRRNMLIVDSGHMHSEDVAARVADAALMLFLPQAAAIDGESLRVN